MMIDEDIQTMTIHKGSYVYDADNRYSYRVLYAYSGQ